MKLNIGVKIRKIREERNIKQEEIARFLKITQSAYSKLETEASRITPELILSIASYTKTPIHEFFPADLVNLQQIDFRMQLQDAINETNTLKEINSHLLKRLKTLEKLIEENKAILPSLIIF